MPTNDWWVYGSDPGVVTHFVPQRQVGTRDRGPIVTGRNLVTDQVEEINVCHDTPVVITVRVQCLLLRLRVSSIRRTMSGRIRFRSRGRALVVRSCDASDVLNNENVLL